MPFSKMRRPYHYLVPNGMSHVLGARNLWITYCLISIWLWLWLCLCGIWHFKTWMFVGCLWHLLPNAIDQSLGFWMQRITFKFYGYAFLVFHSSVFSVGAQCKCFLGQIWERWFCVRECVVCPFGHQFLGSIMLCSCWVWISSWFGRSVGANLFGMNIFWLWSSPPSPFNLF